MQVATEILFTLMFTLALYVRLRDEMEKNSDFEWILLMIL